MRLIFFGGSFDPPHRGHYEIIQHCTKQCDQLVLMPTLHSPLKNQSSYTEPCHILKMLELLIEFIDYPIQIDDWDFNQSEPSYTFQTIRYLKKKYPGFSISMVIGADQLVNFKKWKNYKEIISSIHLIGFNRANIKYTPLQGMNLTWIKDFNVEISSMEIRENIAAGKLKENDLIHPVKNYIQKKHLYAFNL